MSAFLLRQQSWGAETVHTAHKAQSMYSPGPLWSRFADPERDSRTRMHWLAGSLQVLRMGGGWPCCGVWENAGTLCPWLAAAASTVVTGWEWLLSLVNHRATLSGLQPPQPASCWSSEGTTFPARVQLCSCSSLITSLTPTPLPNFSSEVTFYFILSYIQAVGFRQTLYFMIIADWWGLGWNDTCFHFENQETKFPGLISPVFEFLWTTVSVNTPCKIQLTPASLPFQADVRAKWDHRWESSLEIKSCSLFISK